MSKSLIVNSIIIELASEIITISLILVLFIITGLRLAAKWRNQV